MKKDLLIVVDMINGFVKEGLLHDIKINSITPNIIKLIKEFKGDLVFVRDSHKINCDEFKLYPVHCLEGSYESELIDELKEYECLGKTFLKNTTNAMNEELFREYLNNNDYQNIILTGCCTDICIKNLAISLIDYYNSLNKNINIIVPENCVDTFDGINHNRDLCNKNALEELESKKVLIKRMER